MRVLSPRQLRIARALTATLFDDGSGIPPERLDYAMAELARYAARVGRFTRLALAFALWVMQLAPLLFLGIFRRFTDASAEIRLRCLRRLEVSRLGLVMVLLKTVLSLIYFEHPDALASTGYDAQGLLGPAWAQGDVSPVARLRVIENAPKADTPVPLPQLAREAVGGA
jgi:hypothetical protein